MVPRTWTCAVCRVVVTGSSLCGGCRKVAYCGKEHQLEDRAAHKPNCFYPFIQKGGIEVNQVLQFDISLLPQDIDPRIWRKIQVPKNFNFRQFHRAIQIAFDWHSADHPYHQHQFLFDDGHHEEVIGIKDDKYNCAVSVGVCEKFFNKMRNRDSPLDDRKKFLKDYFSGPAGAICLYEYDFGDRWEHTIEYEGEFPAEPDVEYPRCLAGERAGIPEDAGNYPGYYEKCEIIKNPKHKEYKDIVKWLESQGKPNWNPDTFDPSEIDFHF